MQNIGGHGDVNQAYGSLPDEQELQNSYATTGDRTYQHLDGTRTKPYENFRS